MPPSRKGKKTASKDAQPAGMPMYNPPQLRVAKSSGVFVESVADEDLIRQAHADMTRVPWNDLKLMDSATEKAFLAYHLVCVMPITMQTLEQGAYHKEYMHAASGFIHVLM